MVPNKEAIFIIGMHRSGTSVLARSINLLGYHLGEKVLPPAKDNPDGFWENDSVVKINDSILKKLDSGWADYRALPKNWEQMDCLNEEKAKITHLLQSDFGSSDKILIKDPRLCRTCRLWFPILKERGFEVKIAGTIRHPLEVASSLIRRNPDVHPAERLSKNEAVLLWIRYLFEGEVNTQNYQVKTYLFPQFLESGDDFWNSLLSFLRPEVEELERVKTLVLGNFSSKEKPLRLPETDSELPKIALSIWGRMVGNHSGVEATRQSPEDLRAEISIILESDALVGEIYQGWKSRTASLFSVQSKIEAPGQILKKSLSRIRNSS